jgi:GH25 family lysozyme M1 (1,4-beta-N-acetylmuramidase)
MDVQITDTSRWQEEINYEIMKKKYHGTVLKCGQGTAKDRYFDENRKKAKIAKMPAGTYWYYDSRVDPYTQAALWASWVDGQDWELPHFADYEENYGGAWGGIQNLRIFITEFQRLTGFSAKQIGVYTGYYYWVAHSSKVEYEFFENYWLWLAWYSTPEQVAIPLPWTQPKLLFWQDTSHENGTEAGVSSLNVDRSFFLQPAEEYYKLFGLPNPEIPQGEEPVNTYELTVLTPYLNGRESPNGPLNFPAGPTLVTGFRFGDKLTANLAQSNWYRITSCLRGTSNVQIPSPVWAFAGDTGGYMRLDKTNVDTLPNPKISFEFTDRDGKVFEAVDVELKPK